MDSSSYFIALSRYKFQLIGLKNASGQREVYVNYLGAHYEPNWKARYLQMMDGGNRFFQVHIDLEHRKCLRFHANGDA